MNNLKKIGTTVALGAIALVGLYGCGGESPTSTPLPPTATVAAPTNNAAAPTATTATGTSGSTGGTASTPATSGGATGSGVSADVLAVLNKSDAAMKNVKTFHFTMDEESGGTSLLTGVGDFQLPDMAHLTITNAAGTTEMISIGQDAYVTQSGMGTWINVGGSGNPLASLSSLANPDQTGSFAKLADTASVVGDENVNGVSTTHITFSYDVQKAMEQAAQASGTPLPTMGVPTGKAAGDMWIEKDSGYISKLKVVTPGAPDISGGVTTPTTTTDITVTVTYSKYNETITPPITKPTNVTDMPSSVTGSDTPTP